MGTIQLSPSGFSNCPTIVKSDSFAVKTEQPSLTPRLRCQCGIQKCATIDSSNDFDDVGNFGTQGANRRHPEAPGSTREAPRRHPGGTHEAPRTPHGAPSNTQEHPGDTQEAARTIQEAPRRHPGPVRKRPGTQKLNFLGFGNSCTVWKCPGGAQDVPRTCPEAPRRHPEAPCRYPEAPRSTQKQPGGNQEAPRMHPEAQERYLATPLFRICRQAQCFQRCRRAVSGSSPLTA